MPFFGVAVRKPPHAFSRLGKIPACAYLQSIFAASQNRGHRLLHSVKKAPYNLANTRLVLQKRIL